MATHSANIDWCEANYAVTPFVAEWMNTCSMIPGIACTGAECLRCITTLRRHGGPSAKPSFVYAAIAYGLSLWLSVGSFMFHATLQRAWQIHDELPMLYLGVWTAMCVYRRVHGTPVTPADVRDDVTTLGCTGILVTYLYGWTTRSYLLFVVPYAIATIATLSVLLAHILQNTNPASRRQGVGGIASLLLGFLLWIVDHVLCLPASPFHALWHIAVVKAQCNLIEYVTMAL